MNVFKDYEMIPQSGDSLTDIAYIEGFNNALELCEEFSKNNTMNISTTTTRDISNTGCDRFCIKCSVKIGYTSFWVDGKGPYCSDCVKIISDSNKCPCCKGLGYIDKKGDGI